jgi:hypothetical protein
MILQWCDATPCLGATCPGALARYGQPTIGHTIPVPPGEHTPASIVALFERHLTRAVVRDPEGIPRRLPPDFAFTIHTVTTTIDGPRQYYTAIYSGTTNLEAALRAAPVADDSETSHDGELNVADAVPVQDRWGTEPQDAVTALGSTPPVPELEKPGTAQQTRQW